MSPACLDVLPPGKQGVSPPAHPYTQQALPTLGYSMVHGRAGAPAPWGWHGVAGQWGHRALPRHRGGGLRTEHVSVGLTGPDTWKRAGSGHLTLTCPRAQRLGTCPRLKASEGHHPALYMHHAHTPAHAPLVGSSPS